jgi:hypothetical protein
VPAAVSEELHFIVYGWDKEERFLQYEMRQSVTELNQAASKGS